MVELQLLAPAPCAPSSHSPSLAPCPCRAPADRTTAPFRLSLHDGSVLCGRRQHDGSGGSGCALQAGKRVLRSVVAAAAAAQRANAPLRTRPCGASSEHGAARGVPPAPLVVVKLGTVSCDLTAGVLKACQSWPLLLACVRLGV